MTFSNGSINMYPVKVIRKMLSFCFWLIHCADWARAETPGDIRCKMKCHARESDERKNDFIVFFLISISARRRTRALKDKINVIDPFLVSQMKKTDKAKSSQISHLNSNECNTIFIAAILVFDKNQLEKCFILENVLHQWMWMRFPFKKPDNENVFEMFFRWIFIRNGNESFLIFVISNKDKNLSLPNNIHVYNTHRKVHFRIHFQFSYCILNNATTFDWIQLEIRFEHFFLLLSLSPQYSNESVNLKWMK